jgi:hypothetical protein
MKCHTNDNSTSSTQLPHKFSYIVAILGHNHFESPNMFQNEFFTPFKGKFWQRDLLCMQKKEFNEVT